MTLLHTFPALTATQVRDARRWVNIAARKKDTTTGNIDWIAVERAANGELHPNNLNLDEQRETVLALDDAGFPEKTISSRLCLYEYAVAEHLAMAGRLAPHRICTIEGCWHARSSHGLCKGHFMAERVLVEAAEREKKIRRLAARGKSPEQIGKAVKRSAKFIRQYLAEQAAAKEAA